ncbi:Receptor-type tyrosine-protein phosphatase R [Apodemus speciosus]|uniref:Receptor-type tyrosine-protein phosphatase R n=1 Tax=Apodemus speciosus TaxID=105296 RepID=A0ABQ0F8H2_APOSI
MRCFSGNNDHFLAIRQKKSWKPVFIYDHSQDIKKSLDIAQEAYKHSYHSPSEVQISKRRQIINSAFPRPAYDPSLNLLAASGQDLEIENLPIPAANVIVVESSKEDLEHTLKRLNAKLQGCGCDVTTVDHSCDDVTAVDHSCDDVTTVDHSCDVTTMDHSCDDVTTVGHSCDVATMDHVCTCLF